MIYVQHSRQRVIAISAEDEEVCHHQSQQWWEIEQQKLQ